VKAWLLALLLLAASSPCPAHEDQPIGLAPDGTLTGLPATYQPARLTLQFSIIDGEKRLTSLRLKLGSAAVLLPTCLLGLIRTQQAAQLVLGASWQHDEAVVPHYLSARFLDPENGAPSFTLLFNLHTARVLDLSVDIARSAGETQSLPLDLRARCGADELQDILAH